MSRRSRWRSEKEILKEKIREKKTEEKVVHEDVI